MRNVLKRTDKYFWFATAIIAAGCAVRLFALGSIPCGLNQDEAFARIREKLYKLVGFFWLP